MPLERTSLIPPAERCVVGGMFDPASRAVREVENLWAALTTRANRMNLWAAVRTAS